MHCPQKAYVQISWNPLEFRMVWEGQLTLKQIVVHKTGIIRLIQKKGENSLCGFYPTITKT